MKTIVFSEDVKEFVFEVFNKSVDEDGYIVEKGNKSRVITPAGEHVPSKDFAAIIPGSEVFVTNDMPSLLKYVNRETASEYTN